jgi:hypothetical protein
VWSVRRYAFAAGVVVALGVLAWVLFSVGGDGGRERRPRPARESTGATKSAPPDAPAKSKARPVPPPTDPANVPAPRPRKTAEQARAELRALMDELDAIAGRGDTLSHEAWVERYKRGSDALQDLVRALDPSDPAAQQEIGKANEDFRKQLARVQGR